jgi:hypothetical protein
VIAVPSERWAKLYAPFDKNRIYSKTWEADVSARFIRVIEKLAQTGSPAIQSRGKKLSLQLKHHSQKNKRQGRSKNEK